MTIIGVLISLWVIGGTISVLLALIGSLFGYDGKLPWAKDAVPIEHQRNRWWEYS